MLRLLLLISWLVSAWCDSKYYGAASQFHPTGRILATEHSKKIVATKGGPVCAFKCKDGIVLSASMRFQPSKLHVGPSQKIFHVDRHIAVAVSGIVFESENLIHRAKVMCMEHQYIYSSTIPVEKLCDQLATELHECTRGTKGQSTPAVSLVVCGWDEELGPQVFSVDPEGSSRGWNAIAIGAHSSVLQDELAGIVSEEQSGGDKADATFRNTMNHVWPKFKSRILRKYFKNGAAEAPLQPGSADSDSNSGAASDELDWGGGLPGGAGEWSTEVYTCLRASMGEVCWSKVTD